MQEIRVETWNQLQDALHAGSWRAEIERYRSPFLFRGEGNAAARLVTSLISPGDNFLKMEPHLLRNFRKYASRNVVERDTTWHWLTMGQHYGLPTRLLDWTSSPLVAAHFATAELSQYGEDGVIWMVNTGLAHRMLPQAFKDALKAEGADYFTVEMLAGLAKSLAAFDAYAPPLFVLFFEPPAIDERIINQYAFFSVMPDPAAVLSDWLADYPELWRKVIIPAGLKWEVRDRLDQANITERVLFPGLEGLSRWQRRYYSSRKSGKE